MKTKYEQRKKPKGQNIMRKMIDLRDRMSAKAGYPCHTESPYHDGYGDAGYGDYSDA